MAHLFQKEMPGAELFFRPADLETYADAAWDIRISIGDAPLDEAFFCSVDSLAEADRPIGELLESIALNPECVDALDLDHYPELPFLQTELRQLFDAAKREQLSLAVVVNGFGRVSLDETARGYLSACVFRNKSWDYLVLDLIFSVELPEIDANEVRAFCARYSALSPADIETEAEQLLAYEKYGSVSIAPVALGVPDGFDVRLQMMEFDGLLPERCVLVQLLNIEPQPLEQTFAEVREGLAFQTHFSAEVMAELKRCGQVFEDA